MTRRAISVTLDADNVTWLKGRAGAVGESVSALIDQLVSAARQGGRIGPPRSVVGTIDIDTNDPLLSGADTLVRSAFDHSLGRPFIVREDGARHRTHRKTARKRGA
jgi:hypothetical protein